MTIQTSQMQSMLYIANDLVIHKQHYSKQTKALFKNLLCNHLPPSEITALEERYDAAAPVTEKFADIPRPSALF